MANAPCRVFYNCTIAGKFELHVLSEGEEIKGSPYPLNIASGPTFATQCIVKDPPKEGKGKLLTIRHICACVCVCSVLRCICVFL